MYNIVTQNQFGESAADLTSTYKVNTIDDGDSSMRVSEFVSTYTKRVVEKTYNATMSMDANQLIKMNDAYLTHVSNTGNSQLSYNGQKLLE